MVNHAHEIEAALNEALPGHTRNGQPAEFGDDAKALTETVKQGVRRPVTRGR